MTWSWMKTLSKTVASLISAFLMSQTHNDQYFEYGSPIPKFKYVSLQYMVLFLETAG